MQHDSIEDKKLWRELETCRYLLGLGVGAALQYLEDYPDLKERMLPGDDVVLAIIEDARRLRKDGQS